ncbi:MAG: hypothetical protein M1132_12910 [Chloroflexi bacterium]|nr:hypothetical protein [Chloroflexota bacterium]
MNTIPSPDTPSPSSEARELFKRQKKTSRLLSLAVVLIVIGIAGYAFYAFQQSPYPAATPPEGGVPQIVVTVNAPTVVVGQAAITVNAPTVVVNVTPGPIGVTVVVTQQPTPTETPTVAPTLTPSPTPTLPPRYAPVKLREPQDGQTFQSFSITFEWNQVPLQEGDHYQVFIKRAASQAWEKTFDPTGLGKKEWPYEEALGYSDYTWTVLVVNGEGRIVSQQGETRRLTWQHRDKYGSDCAKCHHH